MTENVPNESNSQIEILEKDLRYVQQQHRIIVDDLRKEIDRLQEENKELRNRLSTNNPPINQRSSPNSDKSTDDKQAQIDELERKLLQTESRNRHLMQKLEELNQANSLKPTTIDENPSSARTNDSDYQQLLSVLQEKQQQYFQQISKFRAAFLDLLNTERLSLSSKILLRDCLNSTNISELSMSKTTTTPVDMLFFDEKQAQQQRSTASPSVAGKTSLLRPELPIHRLTISPPQAATQRLNNQSRVNLPAILQRNNSTLSQHSADVNGLVFHSITPTDSRSYQRMLKIGETPIARRERRTQELQKNRLMKTLFH